MNHEIPLSEAVDMTKRFRQLRPVVVNPEFQDKDILATCETFDRAAFDRLLALNDCTRIRVYYGMTEDMKMHAIFVGVDSDGRDILPGEGSEGLIMDQGDRCPTQCPPASALNS